MTLPIAVSVPHMGLKIPHQLIHCCRLTADQIQRDSDEGAAEIYDLEGKVHEFVFTDIARAFVDVNRAANDRRGRWSHQNLYDLERARLLRTAVQRSGS